MSAIGTAGLRGKGVRSDCWVSVTIADTGPIRLDLASKVDFLYGDSIRALVARELKALGVEHAQVEIEDQGALEFVLAARIETAVRRALPDRDVPAFLPDLSLPAMRPSSRERWRRSRLYLPGNQPKYMLNAHLHRPDGVILDLEDSVPPAEKDAALVLVRNALRVLDFGDCEKMVRINQLPLGLGEIPFLVEAGVHLLLIPKCESVDMVKQVADRIEESKQQAGLDNDVYLMPIIESPLGMYRALEIAQASPLIVALTYGLEDYTAELCSRKTPEALESLWARSQIVNAARAAHVQPIDTVFANIGDMDALRQNVLQARAFGFEGKGCIHPRQIPVVHEAFAPTKTEIDRAKQVMLGWKDAQQHGLSVVSVGSKMIDPPIVDQAQRTIRLAIAQGLLSDDWQEREGNE